MKSKTLIASLFAALLLFPFGSTASAQESAPAGTTVSLKLDVVAWGDSIEGLRITTGGKDIAVRAEAFEYSNAVSYNGSNVLEISKTAGAASTSPPPAPADAEPPANELEKRRVKNPDLVALALLPSNSRRATVLVAPGANGTYLTYVIDDDPSKLPPGNLRIHNQCSIPIAIRCNSKTSAELKLKESVVVKPVEQVVVYELAYQKDGKWKMQENNIVRVNDTDQVQMIILKSDADFFTSSDGSRGGFLQTVVLRRGQKQMADETSPEGQATR